MSSIFNSSFIWFVTMLLLLTYTHGCLRQQPQPPPRNRSIQRILSVVRNVLPMSSFEVYDFKIGWYNDLVESKFDLPYHPNTMALSTFTIPGVFESSFLPFLCKKGLSVANDSWPQFSQYYMKKVQRALSKTLKLNVSDGDILYPHIMLGPGHPQILVQTSAHVSGAAYYYQKKDVIESPWPKNKTIYGVSLHPKYGGWFYMGPVIILRDVKDFNVKKKPVKDVLVTDAKKIQLLDLYNGDWRSQKWRDVIKVEKKYSHDHVVYSMTYGAKRTSWVTSYYNKHCLIK